MAGSHVANKAGGYWLGTFLFALLECAFILYIKRTGTKGQNGCASQRARASAQRGPAAAALCVVGCAPRRAVARRRRPLATSEP